MVFFIAEFYDFWHGVLWVLESPLVILEVGIRRIAEIAGLSEKVCAVLWAPWQHIAHVLYAAATILKFGG